MVIEEPTSFPVYFDATGLGLGLVLGAQHCAPQNRPARSYISSEVGGPVNRGGSFQRTSKSASVLTPTGKLAEDPELTTPTPYTYFKNLTTHLIQTNMKRRLLPIRHHPPRRDSSTLCGDQTTAPSLHI
ncbi:hypothetical protein DL769_010638 [Monosporascus sp. CRB-8-3]|nr:hypothetical protein DL769_010638 [Monosporascus sp. CRB-8-3]